MSSITDIFPVDRGFSVREELTEMGVQYIVSHPVLTENMTFTIPNTGIRRYMPDIWKWNGVNYDFTTFADICVNTLWDICYPPETEWFETENGFIKNEVRKTHKALPTQIEGGTYWRKPEAILAGCQRIQDQFNRETSAIEGEVALTRLQSIIEHDGWIRVLGHPEGPGGLPRHVKESQGWKTGLTMLVKEYNKHGILCYLGKSSTHPGWIYPLQEGDKGEWKKRKGKWAWIQEPGWENYKPVMMTSQPVKRGFVIDTLIRDEKPPLLEDWLKVPMHPLLAAQVSARQLPLARMYANFGASHYLPENPADLGAFTSMVHKGKTWTLAQPLQGWCPGVKSDDGSYRLPITIFADPKPFGATADQFVIAQSIAEQMTFTRSIRISAANPSKILQRVKDGKWIKVCMAPIGRGIMLEPGTKIHRNQVLAILPNLDKAENPKEVRAEIEGEFGIIESVEISQYRFITGEPITEVIYRIKDCKIPLQMSAKVTIGCSTHKGTILIIPDEEMPWITIEGVLTQVELIAPMPSEKRGCQAITASVAEAESWLSGKAFVVPIKSTPEEIHIKANSSPVVLLEKDGTLFKSKNSITGKWEPKRVECYWGLGQLLVTQLMINQATDLAINSQIASCRDQLSPEFMEKAFPGDEQTKQTIADLLAIAIYPPQ